MENVEMYTAGAYPWVVVLMHPSPTLPPCRQAAPHYPHHVKRHIQIGAHPLECMLTNLNYVSFTATISGIRFDLSLVAASAWLEIALQLGKPYTIFAYTLWAVREKSLEK